MNKYEKALNNVRKFEREHNMSKFGDVVPQPNSDTLQELVDKETPMKVDKNTKGSFPNYDKDDTYHTTYKCPKCNCTIHLDWHEERNFCSECGVKLDWGDECE